MTYMYNCDIEIAEEGSYRSADVKQIILDNFARKFNGNDNPFDFSCAGKLIESSTVRDIVLVSKDDDFTGIMFVAFINGQQKEDFCRLYFQEGRYDLVIPLLRHPWSQWLHYGMSISPAHSEATGEF